MNRLTRIATGTATVVALAAVAAGIAATRGARLEASPALRHDESRIRDLDISFYAERASRDPSGAADLAQVASLYLERGRETGDPADAARAEDAARKSFANRSARNDRALSVLGASLLSQHRFQDALAVTARLAANNPGNAAILASLGEIQLELGRYADADTTFRALQKHSSELAVAPRYARWLEIGGHAGAARTLLDHAVRSAERTVGLPSEQMAWYWLRLGDLDFRTGAVGVAEADYKKGLRARPDDYRILSAMAHLAAVRGQPAAAIEYGERAIAAVLDPATLATLSGAYAAVGDTNHADEYAHALEVAVLRQPGAYHRAWSLFLLDRGEHVADVAAKVREELRTRKDIYAWDLYAWSLHAEGDDVRARTAVTTALAQGTEDASLFFHAGMIEHRLGNDDAARGYLEHALRVNQFFHATEPTMARAVLDSLGVRTLAGHD